jgi:hypothetical protein
MSALINFSLNIKDLPKDKLIQGKKGTYINLTMSINEETKFGNNAGIYISQSKEERDAEVKRVYLGNGKVVWNDGQIKNADEEDQAEAVEVEEHLAGRKDDVLPF